MKVHWDRSKFVSDAAAKEPVIIAKIGPEDPPGRSMRSIDKMKKRVGDMIVNASGTRGDSMRHQAIEMFMNSQYNRLFLVDTDQVMETDTLERLRGLDLDIVNGLYFRRAFPVKPVAFEDSDYWPLLPFLVYPLDALCTIGATGFGCMLIRRQPLEDLKTKVLRKWEPWVWNGPYPERTGHYRSVGADLRFFQQLIHNLGYEVWLDTGTKVGHMTAIPLGERAYIQQGGARMLRGNYSKTVERRIREGGQSPMDEEILNMETRAQEEEVAALQKQYEAVRDKMLIAQGKLQALQRLRDLGKERAVMDNGVPRPILEKDPEETRLEDLEERIEYFE